VANEISLDRSVSNYAVFGNPVKHSKSPQIHSLFAEQTGIALNYQAIEVPIENFSGCVELFSSQGGRGLNITVPFKEKACSICTTLTQRAETSGSVNTIRFDEHKNIHGDTTDGQGLINDLTINHAINLKNKSILILGAGGSVKAILEPLCQQEPDSIIIANRTVPRAEQLAEKFSDQGNIEACSYTGLSNRSFDLIINGTSLSLMGELPPIPGTVIKNDACCYDLMYSDTDTIFMKWAGEQGAEKILDGLGMLVEQAAESFLIWHGVKPDTAPVIKSLRKVKS
jgi:shikimate dehydrogenase